MDMESLMEAVRGPSGKLTLVIVLVNVIGAIVMPAVLAGVGYLAGWVVGGIVAGVLILCPFVTVLIIAYLEDYLCLCFYTVPCASGGSGAVEDVYDSSHGAVPYSPDPRQLNIPRVGSIPHMGPNAPDEDADLYEAIGHVSGGGTTRERPHRVGNIHEVDITQGRQYTNGVENTENACMRDDIDDVPSREWVSPGTSSGKTAQDDKAHDSLSVHTVHEDRADDTGSVTRASKA